MTTRQAIGSSMFPASPGLGMGTSGTHLEGIRSEEFYSGTMKTSKGKKRNTGRNSKAIRHRSSCKSNIKSKFVENWSGKKSTNDQQKPIPGLLCTSRKCSRERKGHLPGPSVFHHTARAPGPKGRTQAVSPACRRWRPRTYNQRGRVKSCIPPCSRMRLFRRSNRRIARSSEVKT